MCALRSLTLVIELSIVCTLVLYASIFCHPICTLGVQNANWEYLVVDYVHFKRWFVMLTTVCTTHIFVIDL